MHIDRRLLGWGAFFVIAGAIPLLVRADLLQRDVLGNWPSLWPLLLIGGGLGLLLRGTPLHVLGGIVSVLTAGVMVGGLLTSGFGGVPSFGCGTGTNATTFPDRSGALAGPGSMRIEFDCGTLDVSAQDGDTWNLSGRAPARRAPQVIEGADTVRFFSPRDETFNFGDDASTWFVKVPRTPSLDLSVTLNAGEGAIDLTGVRVSRFSFTLNAGSLTSNLEGAHDADQINGTVNAGSARVALPSGTPSANLTVNAGSLAVCVPADSALRISWSAALAGNNLDDLGLVKVDDNHWTTTGLGASTSATSLNVSANAGSFKLQIGGSCNA